MELVCYSDADYAGDVVDRKSTSGYVCMLGGATVCWRSERQSVVATSTTEAEYVAAAEAVKEIIWARRMVEELVESINIPVLHLDNHSAIKLIENPVFHRRTKHIDVRKRQEHNKSYYRRLELS